MRLVDLIYINPTLWKWMATKSFVNTMWMFAKVTNWDTRSKNNLITMYRKGDGHNEHNTKIRPVCRCLFLFTFYRLQKKIHSKILSNWLYAIEKKWRDRIRNGSAFHTQHTEICLKYQTKIPQLLLNIKPSVIMVPVMSRSFRLEHGLPLSWCLGTRQYKIHK